MSIRKSTTSPVSGTDRADLNDSFAVSEAEPSQLHGHVEYGADVSVGVEDASGFTAEDAFQVGGEEDEEQVSTVTNGAVVPQSVVAAESADEDVLLRSTKKEEFLPESTSIAEPVKLDVITNVIDANADTGLDDDPWMKDGTPEFPPADENLPEVPPVAETKVETSKSIAKQQIYGEKVEDFTENSASPQEVDSKQTSSTIADFIPTPEHIHSNLHTSETENEPIKQSQLPWESHVEQIEALPWEEQPQKVEHVLPWEEKPDEVSQKDEASFAMGRAKSRTPRTSRRVYIAMGRTT